MNILDSVRRVGDDQLALKVGSGGQDVGNDALLLEHLDDGLSLR